MNLAAEANCQLCRLGNLQVSCPTVDKAGEPCLLCNGTGKRLYRHHILWVDGPTPNDLLLLGEAPGVNEDLEGLPFRPDAAAGRVLHQALKELRMDPAIDNIVRCHPPENKLKDYPDAITSCIYAWLPAVLRQVQPRVIVTLGALAGGTWFPGMKAHEMSQAARACVIDEWKGIIIGCLHPSYAARGTDPMAYPSILWSLRRAASLV